MCYAIPVQATSIGWVLGGVLMDTIGNFETVLVSVFGGLIIVVIAMISSKEFRNA